MVSAIAAGGGLVGAGVGFFGVTGIGAGLGESSSGKGLGSLVVVCAGVLVILGGVLLGTVFAFSIRSPLDVGTSLPGSRV